MTTSKARYTFHIKLKINMLGMLINEIEIKETWRDFFLNIYYIIFYIFSRFKKHSKLMVVATSYPFWVISRTACRGWSIRWGPHCGAHVTSTGKAGGRRRIKRRYPGPRGSLFTKQSNEESSIAGSVCGLGRTNHAPLTPTAPSLHPSD